MPFEVPVTKAINYATKTISTVNTHSCQGVVVKEESIDDAETDLAIGISIDISTMLAFGMSATVDMTVETNSGSAPQETFTLLAGEILVWETGDTAIFAGDVTNFFVTNASGADGVLNIIVGTDA